jgi:hypothetical protein
MSAAASPHPGAEGRESHVPARAAGGKATLSHERLGHANFGSLEKMVKLEMVRGMPPISHAEQFCDTCVLAKHHHGAFLKQSRYCADKALELVHDDLYGPVKSVTSSGRRYFLLLVDDATRYMWVVLLAAKSEATIPSDTFRR